MFLLVLANWHLDKKTLLIISKTYNRFSIRVIIGEDKETKNRLSIIPDASHERKSRFCALLCSKKMQNTFFGVHNAKILSVADIIFHYTYYNVQDVRFHAACHARNCTCRTTRSKQNIFSHKTYTKSLISINKK